MTSAHYFLRQASKTFRYLKSLLRAGFAQPAKKAAPPLDSRLTHLSGTTVQRWNFARLKCKFLLRIKRAKTLNCQSDRYNSEYAIRRQANGSRSQQCAKSRSLKGVLACFEPWSHTQTTDSRSSCTHRFGQYRHRIARSCALDRMLSGGQASR